MAKLPKACQLRTELFVHSGKAVRVRQTSGSSATHIYGIKDVRVRQTSDSEIQLVCLCSYVGGLLYTMHCINSCQLALGSSHVYSCVTTSICFFHDRAEAHFSLRRNSDRTEYNYRTVIIKPVNARYPSVYNFILQEYL